MEGKTIDEVFVLRSLACLSIALLHSINTIYPSPDEAINVMRLVLSFGTPAFVFISELVLSYAYPDGVPKNFWSKRIKFILFPYIVFGFINALADAVLQSSHSLIGSFISYSLQYILLGDFSAYFIVIIFQFYLFHAYIAPKVLHKFSLRTVLISSLIISMSYWAFFNFVPQFNLPFKAYIYNRFYMLPFIGWIFYFALAYYCGRQYRETIRLLNKYRYWVWTAAAATSAWMIVNFTSGIITAVSSKRLDMVLFVASMVFLVLQLSSKLKRIPSFWVRISQISFGLFLIHPIFFGILERGLKPVIDISETPIGVIVNFVIGMLLSAWAVLFANRFRWGAYLVGRIGIGRREASSSSPARPLQTIELKTP